jgi:hypothetical protein
MGASFHVSRSFVASRLAGGDGPRTVAYFWRRALRILPANWVALTITVFLLYAPRDLSSPAPSCCSGGGVRVWPLLSTAVVVALTTALTYGQQRFRVAAEPSLVVLAAVSVAAVGGRRRVESSTESRKTTEGT